MHRPKVFFGYRITEQDKFKIKIAEPEKALIDSIYLSTRKKKQFSYFPELYLDEKFDFKKAMRWVGKIPSHAIRVSVASKLKKITAGAKVKK